MGLNDLCNHIIVCYLQLLSPIKQERLFDLVQSPFVNPDYLTVYNHASNKVRPQCHYLGIYM